MIWIPLLTMACNCVQPQEAVSPAELAPSRPISEVLLSDPESAYARCQARVEGEEQPGECSTDADCAQAGCSRELCVPVSAAEASFSSCEQRLCFNALDTCGCQAGLCRWSLKPAGPAGPAPAGR